MQNHDGDLSEFFTHDIQSFSPSLSDLGNSICQTKTDLLKYFELTDIIIDLHSFCDCLVLCNVHLLSTTCRQAVHSLLVNKQLEKVRTIDVLLWDMYISNSLKESTQGKRGNGVHRKVSGQTKFPGNCIFSQTKLHIYSR